MKKRFKYHPDAKRQYSFPGNEMSGTGGNQLILHCTGVNSKTVSASGVASYVCSKGVPYTFTIDVNNTNQFFQIMPFDKAALSLLNGGVAGGVGANKAGKIKIQGNVINNKKPGKELHGKLPNDFLDIILDICEEYNIPLRYLPHPVGGRCSEKVWANESGISAHRYAPGNDHTDLPLPRSFLRQLKARQVARKKEHVTKPPVTPSKPAENSSGKDTNTTLKRAYRVLRKGSRGKQVVRLQKELGITADGLFGNGTHKSVVLFQKKHKLTADGIVGKDTWKALGYELKPVDMAKKYPWLVLDSDTTMCNPKLARKANKLGKLLGRKLFVNEGTRTPYRCWELRMLYLRGKGNLAARCCSKYDRTQHTWKQCGKDPWSNHADGNALDLQDNATKANIGNVNNARNIMHKLNLCLPVGGENWHVEIGNSWRA